MKPYEGETMFTGIIITVALVAGTAIEWGFIAMKSTL
jgi:hypothetical protein